MDKIPIEWIEKIFTLLAEYFGENWAQITKGKEAIIKQQWQNGLEGLTHEEIKSALFVSRNLARNKQQPPHLLDFYHYGKGNKPPPRIISRQDYKQNPELSTNSIDKIRKILKRA